MSIFDGFENETPEQVAAKLGIKKEVLEGHTKNDILEVTENTNTIDISEYENDNKWEEICDINSLVSGMRIRFGSWKSLGSGKIINVNKTTGTITVLYENRMDTLTKNLKTFTNKFQIYKTDKHLIQEVYTLNQADALSVGMIILGDIPFDNKVVKKIEKSIEYEKGNCYQIWFAYGTAKKYYEQEVKDFNIVHIIYPAKKDLAYLETFEYAKIDPKEVEYEDIWTVESAMNLKIGTRVKHGKLIGKVVQECEEGRGNVVIVYNNGSKVTYDCNNDVLNAYEKDVLADLREQLKLEDIRDKDKWTDEFNSKIGRNTRLIYKNKPNTGEFVIIDTKDNIFTLKYKSLYFGDKETSMVFSYEQIKQIFLIYKKDLEYNTNFIYQNPEKKLFEERHNWADIKNIEDLEVGMTLVYYDSLQGREETIFSIEGNKIKVIFQGGGRPTLDFNEIKQNYKILKKSAVEIFYKNLGLDYNILDDPNLWTHSYVPSDLQEGSLVLHNTLVFDPINVGIIKKITNTNIDVRRSEGERDTIPLTQWRLAAFKKHLSSQ